MRLFGPILAASLLTTSYAGHSALAEGAQNPSFNLLNRSSSMIRELYVTPAGDERWGRNRLTRPVPAGASFPVRRRIDGNCIFDIRVVYADGHKQDRRGVDTCKTEDIAVGAVANTSVAGVSGKASDDPSFRLVNQGGQPITELYATPSGLGHWGENRLVTPLAPGAEQSVHVDRQSSCLFDVKIVLADHKAREKHRTDLCRINDLPVP